MIEINDQLLAAAEDYFQAFGHMLPLRMLPMSLSSEELCAQIAGCIARGEDDLVQRYCGEDGDGVLY